MLGADMGPTPGSHTVGTLEWSRLRTDTREGDSLGVGHRAIAPQLGF